MSRAQTNHIAALQVDLEAAQKRIAELEAEAKARRDEDAEFDRIVGESLKAETFGRYVSTVDRLKAERDALRARVAELEASRVILRGHSLDKLLRSLP